MKKYLLILVLLSTFALPGKCIKSIEFTLPELIVIDSTIIDNLNYAFDNIQDTTCFDKGEILTVYFGEWDYLLRKNLKNKSTDITICFSEELNYSVFWDIVDDSCLDIVEYIIYKDLYKDSDYIKYDDSFDVPVGELELIYDVPMDDLEKLKDVVNDDLKSYYGCFWLTTKLGSRLCVIKKTETLKPERFKFSGENIDVRDYICSPVITLDGGGCIFIRSFEDSIILRSECSW
ncbi:MAG: hypothetical protein R3Y59_10925 [bacterium]